MDEERSIVITIVHWAGALLCTMVLVVTGCTIHQQYMVEQMTLQGIDPIEANCAIAGISANDGRAAICSQVAE